MSASLIQLVWCLSYLWLAKFGDTIWKNSEMLHCMESSAAPTGLRAEQLAAVATILGFTMQFGLGTGHRFDDVHSRSRCRQGRCVPGNAAYRSRRRRLYGTRGTSINASVNRFQNNDRAVFLWIMFAYMCYNVPVSSLSMMSSDSGTMSSLLGELTGWGLATNLLFSLLWQFVDMSTWQTIAASRHEEGKPDVKHNLWVGAGWVFVFPGLSGPSSAWP